MLAIDANIFLELLLAQDRHQECKEFPEGVRDGKIQATISDFNVSGIVLVLERYGKGWQDIRTFLVSLLQYRGLMIYQSTIYDKITATAFMKDHNLDFEDGLTLQCALANKCEHIVSFDNDFNGIKGLKRITPKQIKIK